MTPQAMYYLQILFPDNHERTKAIGFLSINLGVASIFGQFLGGYFSFLVTSTAGWQFIFFINFAVGIIVLRASWEYLTEIKIAAKGRFYLRGVILVISALSCLIYPLPKEGNTVGHGGVSL